MGLARAGDRAIIGCGVGMAGSRRDVDGMGNGKRRLSRSRRAGFVVVDGSETGVESAARQHAASSASSSGHAAVTSDADRIVVPPIDAQISGRAKGKPTSCSSDGGRDARRDGVERGTGDVVSHAGGRHGGAGTSRGDAQKAASLGSGDGTRSHAGRSSAGGMRRGVPGGVTGVRADDGNSVGNVPSPAHKGGAHAVSEASRRSDGVTGSGAYAGRGVGDTGISGRVSVSQAASGSVRRGVRSADAEIGRGDTVSSPSDGGRPVGNGSSADDGRDGGAGTGIGFTEEERRLYEEAHAPLADRVRGAFAESSVPIACVVIVGVAVALRFLMSFSSVVLTVLAIGVGVVLMGSIIYITYEDQRKANALADEAETLYAEKCRIEERAARRNDDAAADGDDGKGSGKTES